MNKEITCRTCQGSGKQKIEICDDCGQEVSCGDYEGRRICQQCWSQKLTEEEIENI